MVVTRDSFAEGVIRVSQRFLEDLTYYCGRTLGVIGKDTTQGVRVVRKT